MIRNYVALRAFLIERMTMPFAWGRRANDCCSFCAAAIVAQGGPFLLEKFPDWTTQAEAEAVIAARGGLEAAVDALLTPCAGTASAMRGDVAVIDAPNGRPLMMLVEGDKLWGPGPAGLRWLPRRAMRKAWVAL